MKARATDYSLYRWRYFIGYAIIALIATTILSVAVFYVAGALRQGELDAALQSGALSARSLTPAMVIDLPYHILQRAGFALFGVSTITIKLPSVILGVLTAIGIYFLIQSWFRRNVAILATVLAITTTQFLYMIQDGTPAIMYSFVTVWLLVAATQITRGKLFGTFWKVVTGVLMATSLYGPLGLYLVNAMIVTASFHPHIRYVLLRISHVRLAITLVLGLLSITPLIYAVIVDQSVAMTLLGLPSGNIDLKHNLTTVMLDMFGFFATSTSHILRPLYSLGVVLLVLIGLYKLFTVKYTARSYMILILGAITLPLIVINHAHITKLYPIVVVLIAMGIATLTVSWYKLFPRNPYARIAGLIPLSIFVGGMVFSGVMRYMNNYTYNPEVLSHYSNDLRLIDRQLGAARASANTTQLITPKDKASFYSLVAHYDKRFTVATNYEDTPEHLIVTHDSYHEAIPVGYTLERIITSRFANNSDRLYLYTKTSK